MLQAPPSRYKIIERDRRLVTIDTLTGDTVGVAPEANTGARVDTAVMRSTSANMGGPVRGEIAMGTARTSAQPAPSTSIGTPRGALTTAASLFPGAQIDADDRITLMTNRYYDAGAPRLVRLTVEKADLLGRFVMAIGILAIPFILAVVYFLTGGFVAIIVIAIIAANFAKPIGKVMMSYIISDAEEVS